MAANLHYFLEKGCFISSKIVSFLDFDVSFVGMKPFF